ncbi:cytochrome P450, partial [Streptomyces sp. NPDC102274]|uniref:cytochrome P450 n=1 Tax=Streptomyces sp. NPDC102274 TaxID=3366151 RepID=UPI0038266C32
MRADHLTELTSAAPDFFADPYPAYQALRAEGPVRRIRMPGGEAVWLVLGYDAVRAALGDTRLRNDIRHSSEFDSDGGYAIGRNMLQVDPPDHTRLRALVSRQFTARRIAGLGPRVQRISAELLDAMAPAGGADLVDAYAFPLPITVICELLGVPAADRDAFHRWSSAIVAITDAEAAVAGATAMTEYLTGLIEDRRHLAPGEDADLLHALVRAHDSEGEDGEDGQGGDGGDRLAPDELLGMAFLLLVAGHETTVNLISSAVHLLLRHPDQLAALRADPGLLEGAIEETLRYEPSAQIA